MKRKRNLQTRSLLLAANGLVSLLITVYQSTQYFGTESVYTRQFSPWIVLYFLPLLLAVVNTFLAFLNHKKNLGVSRFFNWISRHRSLVSIVVLSVLVLVLYGMRVFVDLSDPLINLGMTGIGLLFYSHVLLLLIYTFFQGDNHKKPKKDLFLVVSLLLIFSTWILMAVTGFGLQPDQAYWNVASVPVLWIFLACIILSVISLYQITPWIQKKISWLPDTKVQILFEVVLILAIWICASVIWTNTPYSNSYFLTEPLPPDGHYWPMSDARLMDLGGQYLIIGGKLETPYFTEKPFYALFLGLLHFLFGQSYQTITNIQILVLALIPVFLYLLGKEFSGKILGFALAVFAIIKETNAILSTYKISVSNSRLMMTELPSALLLLIFSLLIIKWLKNIKPDWSLPLISGVIIGVAIFVRSNNLFVLLAFLGLLFFTGLRNIRQRLPQIGIFLFGVIIVITPWTVYNQVTYGKDPLTWKIQSALETRFSITRNETQNETSSEPTISKPDQTTLPGEATPTFLPKHPSGENQNMPQSTDVTASEREKSKPQGFYKSEISMVLAHFLNNQVKALFVLPIQIYPADLSEVLDQEYWKEPVSWNGHLPAESLVAFVVNIVIIAFGLTYAWRTFSWAGMVPLVVEMAYYLSNALVRTSGSRYLVPVDWVIYTYFFLGVWEVLRMLSIIPSDKLESENKSIPSLKRFWIALPIAIIIGLSLPVLNLAFPPLYDQESKTEVLERLPMKKIEDEIGISPQEMKDFYEKANTVFLYGREIYPAYQRIDQASIGKALTFTLITPDLYEIVIPYGIDLSEKLPAGEDMIVLGCKDTTSDQVIAYLGYFVQSDRLIWSTSTTFKDICN